MPLTTHALLIQSASQHCRSSLAGTEARNFQGRVQLPLFSRRKSNVIHLKTHSPAQNLFDFYAYAAAT